MGKQYKLNISCFFPPETLEPLPALTPASRAWLSSEAGVEVSTASEAARSPAVAEAVGRAVERANDAAAESNAHRIKKFAILEKGEDKQSFGGTATIAATKTTKTSERPTAATTIASAAAATTRTIASAAAATTTTTTAAAAAESPQ